MTTNDVSARDLQIRADRPGLRSDWLNGKSHDAFAPMGPYLVPRAFVPDHMKLFIRLTVNGAVKQDGNTSQFIFTPEEQIAYASDILSLECGDIFVCGTCGGVGQGTNTFLNAGDVMETEVEGSARCATGSSRRRREPARRPSSTTSANAARELVPSPLREGSRTSCQKLEWVRGCFVAKIPLTHSLC
jgi:2-keto-4-pentenoate hydratase/2-oxohepta-3-ene-1,7-dioic acid hydratase in catechol pathway